MSNTEQKEKCEWHKPDNLPYMAFFADGDRRTNNGETQRQCPDCRYWFWPHEFGDKPETADNKQS